MLLGARVQEIVIEGGRAVGVRLRDGRIIRGRRGVVSGASIWDTAKLLPNETLSEYIGERGYPSKSTSLTIESALIWKPDLKANGADDVTGHVVPGWMRWGLHRGDAGRAADQQLPALAPGHRVQGPGGSPVPLRRGGRLESE